MKAADPRVACLRRVSRRSAEIRMSRTPSFHVPWFDPMSPVPTYVGSREARFGVDPAAVARSRIV